MSIDSTAIIYYGLDLTEDEQENITERFDTLSDAERFGCDIVDYGNSFTNENTHCL